ncbi:hypothetical protein L6164_033816 [Bauhinia variegata]|uniref:Uncharacterized protein n=1 Tax=Bauhinia variegata TaxID=167791 RepID=A0ACB9KTP7_BAUVA|nr:hypothetical protein L6164_033816 [Bauhinia variegata]
MDLHCRIKTPSVSFFCIINVLFIKLLCAILSLQCYFQCRPDVDPAERQKNCRLLLSELRIPFPLSPALLFPFSFSVYQNRYLPKI